MINDQKNWTDLEKKEVRNGYRPADQQQMSDNPSSSR